MPLIICKRDADGKLVLKDGQTEFQDLELQGEMSGDDYSISSGEIKKYGLKHAWLNANYAQRVLWVPESKSFDDYKVELADFLNQEMTGPYYVDQGFVNTRWTLSIVLLEPADITKFGERYPEWEHRACARAENGYTLGKWDKGQRQMDNPELTEKYGFPRLAAT